MTETCSGLQDGSRVLVTGATGRIGRHLVARLLADGYRVRALTSRPLDDGLPRDPRVEWRQHDFRNSLAFGHSVADCAAVMHLAAEIWRISLMERLNVLATAALAEAAGAAGAQFFGFTSSIAVYGSARERIVRETSPLLTAERDVRHEYRGNSSIRAYGRSKVLGEQAIAAAVGPGMARVIVRPTIVVDLADIRMVLARSRFQRAVLAARHEHLIYVQDVVDALVWLMQQSLDQPRRETETAIYNLSDDDSEVGIAACLFARAAELSDDASLVKGMKAPFFVYDVLDLAKNRMISRRWPLGGMIFSPDKLHAVGWRPAYGLASALALALEGSS